MGMIYRGENVYLADWKMIRPRSPRPSQLDQEDQAFNNNDGQDKQTKNALTPSRAKTVYCDQVEYSLPLLAYNCKEGSNSSMQKVPQ